MIKYKGFRLESGNYGSNNFVLFKKDGGEWERLDWCLNWVNHSPTGLNWGYYGSGCAQLAFAILHHFIKNKYGFYSGEDSARLTRRVYQEFKNDFVAKMKDKWELDGDEIEKWIDNLPTDQIWDIKGEEYV